MAAQAPSAGIFHSPYSLTPLTRNLEWPVVQGESPTGPAMGTDLTAAASTL